jgi:hypothetical protein
MPVILATQEAEIRRIKVRSQLRQIVYKTLSWKYPIQERASGVTQVVECLLSKIEALSSNRSAAKKTKQQQNYASTLELEFILLNT